MKTCTKCGESKALDQYDKHGSQKSRLHPHCKTCKKAYRAAYYEANRERLLADMRQRHAKNPQIARDRMAAWVKANPERHNENRARWLTENHEKMAPLKRAWAAKYRAANPEKKVAWQARRRAAKLHATMAWEPEFDHLVEQEAAALAKLRESCTGVKWHVDHTVPLLSDRVCGLHNAYNLAVIPASVNQRKYNLYWPDMPC